MNASIAPSGSRSASDPVPPPTAGQSPLGNPLHAAIIELATDAILVADDAQCLVLFNHGAEEMFGYGAAEVLGRPLDVLLPARFAASHREEHVPGFAASGVVSRRMGERRAVYGRRRSGEEFPAEVAISRSVVDGQVCYSAIVRDVTERQRLEHQLRASEQRFHGIFDSAFQFIGLLAPDGTLLEANRAALAFAGLTADAVIGRPFWETPFWAHSETERWRLREAIAAAARGAFVRFETEHVGADGQVIAVDFSLKPVHDADGRVTLLIPEGRDVTEARRTAALLRESEETLRTAFEHSGIGMALVGLDGRWHRVNRALCRIVGYDEAELLARTFQDVTHPEDLDADLALMRQLVAGERDAYQLDERYVRRDGQVVWARLNRSLVRDAAGAPRFFISQVQDITAQRAVDLELEHQRAELARSNAELEQFAYVASHDLKEPLRAVASYTQLLGARYADRLDERARRYIGHAVDGATRMGALVDDLLALSRVGTAGRPFAPVELDAVLDEALRGMQVAIADSGGVVTRDPLPRVLGDSAQLRQVLQNLVGNALKFRRPGVPPRVHVSAVAAGGHWTIAVRDNGIGIDPRFAERVFEVFRRLHTRDEYPGTGIGLAICRKAVERHGGRIRVEPAPEGGSVFRFTLPREARQPPAGREG